MQIEVPDLIPPEFELEMFKDAGRVSQLIEEELSNALWRPFMERVMAEMKLDPGNDWTMWEGFWSNENGLQNELAIGALHLDQQIYLRGMRVKGVPENRVKEVQGALKVMIVEYMQALGTVLRWKHDQKKPFTGFGEGKTKGGRFHDQTS